MNFIRLEQAGISGIDEYFEVEAEYAREQRAEDGSDHHATTEEQEKAFETVERHALDEEVVNTSVLLLKMGQNGMRACRTGLQQMGSWQRERRCAALAGMFPRAPNLGEWLRGDDDFKPDESLRAW